MKDRRASSTLLLLWALLSLAGAARADEIRGRVELLAKGGKGAAKGSDVRDVVVYFEPASPSPVRPAAQAFEVVTKDKSFEPRVLAIPRGEPTLLELHDARSTGCEFTRFAATLGMLNTRPSSSPRQPALRKRKKMR